MFDIHYTNLNSEITIKITEEPTITLDDGLELISETLLPFPVDFDFKGSMVKASDDLYIIRHDGNILIITDVDN